MQLKKLLPGLTLMAVLAFAPVAVLLGSAVQVESLWNGLRDTSGQPLSGGKVYTYNSGGLTPKTTWTSASKATAHANPVILSAYGQASVYADGSYRFVITDSNDVTLATIDGLTYADPTAPSSLAPTTLVTASATISYARIDGGTISNVTISNATATGMNLTTPTLYSPNINNAVITNATVTGMVLAGDLNLNNYALTNIATPTGDGSIATKKYVDDTVASFSPSKAYSLASSTSDGFDPSVSGSINPASGTTWVTASSFSIVNSTANDQVFFVRLSVSYQAGGQVSSGTTLASPHCSIALTDDANIVYDQAYVGGALNWLEAAFGGSFYGQAYLSGIAYIPAGATKIFSLSTKGKSGTIELYPPSSNRWYSYFQVK